MKVQKSGLKISTTILLLFFLVIGIISSSTVLLQFYFAKQLAQDATQNSVRLLAEKTSTKVQEIERMSFDTLSLLELSSSLEEKPKANIQHSMLKKFVLTMNTKKYIYAMYSGYETGEFYEVINLDIDDKLRKKYKTTPNEKWLVVKIFSKNGRMVNFEEYLDVNLNITRSVEKPSNYNPTQRPWYKKAIKSDDMIKTKPYMFKNLESMGVTYSKKADMSNTVVSIDISLDSLSSFLKSQKVVKNTELYVFDQRNQLLIASNLKTKRVTDIQKNRLNSVINKDKKEIRLYNKNYLVSVVELKSNYSQKEYLVMLLDEEELMRPYNEKIYLSIYASFFLLLVFLPVIWYASKVIIDPMKLLEKENHKIQNRKFDDVIPIVSKITEINELSSSIVSMSKSIRDYEEAQKNLMDSFIEVIASAIDAKSKYSAGHGQRVPVITMMLANQASKSNSGIFKSFSLKDEEEERELKIAALLHDCGKITTPEYVVDKSTKLETIYNRIHEVRMRFEIVSRDLEIVYYEKLLNGEDKESLDTWLAEKEQSLHNDFEFIANCNIGGEFMKDEDINRIQDISTVSWKKRFDNTLGLSYAESNRLTVKDNTELEYLLSDKYNHVIERTHYSQKEYESDGFKGKVPDNLYNLGEIYNLTIRKGTLTNEERFKINEHIIMTIKMLDQLPFPKHLKRIPEYAGAHHETLIGTGYPKQLTKKDMSIPARIMALADVFEALTAADRPYKDPKKLSESIMILSFMVKDQHIDKDIFELFLTTGVYKEYAIKFLKPEQIDDVDISKYVS
jgi:HD-GYP domain-containing protein (c-di-GMP phosphodiesterase class II)